MNRRDDYEGGTIQLELINSSGSMQECLHVAWVQANLSHGAWASHTKIWKICDSLLWHNYFLPPFVYKCSKLMLSSYIVKEPYLALIPK